MKSDKQKTKRLQFLFFFFFISSIFFFAEYFHIEKDFGEDDNCPICLWERSLFTFGQLYFFCFYLLLILLRRLIPDKKENPHFLFLDHPNCRAPPPGAPFS
jgi:hypothetical protein